MGVAGSIFLIIFPLGYKIGKKIHNCIFCFASKFSVSCKYVFFLFVCRLNLFKMTYYVVKVSVAIISGKVLYFPGLHSYKNMKMAMQTVFP